MFALVEDAQKFAGLPRRARHRAATRLATAPPRGRRWPRTSMACTRHTTSARRGRRSWTTPRPSTRTPTAACSASPATAPGSRAGTTSGSSQTRRPRTAAGDPVRVAFGLEEIWENNQTFTTPLAPNPILHEPYTAQPPASAATDPWVVIGRYWNACAAFNTPITCNQNLKNNPIPGTTTHPDQHAALFVPDGSGGVTLFAGSDGGVYSQHVAAGGDFTNDNWADGNNVGLYSQQPYDAEVANDGTVVAGLQDNGEDKIRQRPPGRDLRWGRVLQRHRSQQQQQHHRGVHVRCAQPHQRRRCELVQRGTPARAPRAPRSSRPRSNRIRPPRDTW